MISVETYTIQHMMLGIIIARRMEVFLNQRRAVLLVISIKYMINL